MGKPGRPQPYILPMVPWNTGKFFGSALNGVEPEDIYAAVNTVRPGLIRVEADEITYNLHIMIRFEIERALIGGDFPAADLPGEWDRKYKECLGLQVPDDTFGCMQDIHWSQGAFGYFPTYTLGNIYAAQFLTKRCKIFRIFMINSSPANSVH